MNNVFDRASEQLKCVWLSVLSGQVGVLGGCAGMGGCDQRAACA